MIDAAAIVPNSVAWSAIAKSQYQYPEKPYWS